MSHQDERPELEEQVVFRITYENKLEIAASDINYNSVRA